jgi:hypothetical protein
MSRDNPVPRCRTWNFSHTLYISILPEATRGLHPTSTIDPFVLIKSLFEKLFKDGPAPVFYIHLRVSRAAFDLCVSWGKTGAALPDLPFAGFIQARSLVVLSIFQPWLDARWTPVWSKLHPDPRYRNEFLAPDDPSFVYILFRGEPALGVRSLSTSALTGILAGILAASSTTHINRSIVTVAGPVLCGGMQSGAACRAVQPVLSRTRGHLETFPRGSSSTSSSAASLLGLPRRLARPAQHPPPPPAPILPWAR